MSRAMTAFVLMMVPACSLGLDQTPQPNNPASRSGWDMGSVTVRLVRDKTLYTIALRAESTKVSDAWRLPGAQDLGREFGEITCKGPSQIFASVAQRMPSEEGLAAHWGIWKCDLAERRCVPLALPSDVQHLSPLVCRAGGGTLAILSRVKGEAVSVLLMGEQESKVAEVPVDRSVVGISDWALDGRSLHVGVRRLGKLPEAYGQVFGMVAPQQRAAGHAAELTMLPHLGVLQLDTGQVAIGEPGWDARLERTSGTVAWIGNTGQGVFLRGPGSQSAVYLPGFVKHLVGWHNERWLVGVSGAGYDDYIVIIDTRTNERRRFKVPGTGEIRSACLVPVHGQRD